MALPATSLTLPSTVTVYIVSGSKLDAGLKTAALSEYVTDPGTLPVPMERAID